MKLGRGVWVDLTEQASPPWRCWRLRLGLSLLCPLACTVGCFSSIPGLHPLDARTPLLQLWQLKCSPTLPNAPSVENPWSWMCKPARSFYFILHSVESYAHFKQGNIMIWFTFLNDHCVCSGWMASRRAKVEEKKSSPQRGVIMPWWKVITIAERLVGRFALD